MSSLSNFEDDDFDPTARLSLPTRQRPLRAQPDSPEPSQAPTKRAPVKKRAAKKAPAEPVPVEDAAPASKALPVGGPKVISARVPKELYDALARHVASLELSEGRPAYSQVVAVACADHRDAVVDTAVQAALQARRDWRAPRGARKAANATMLTLRFWPAELAALEAAQEAVIASRDLDDELRAKVTRTSVIIAALQVSLREGTEILTP